MINVRIYLIPLTNSRKYRKSSLKIVNFHDVTGEKMKEQSKLVRNSSASYRILSGKTNKLLNLINHQSNMGKMFFIC